MQKNTSLFGFVVLTAVLALTGCDNTGSSETAATPEPVATVTPGSVPLLRWKNIMKQE